MRGMLLGVSVGVCGSARAKKRIVRQISLYQPREIAARTASASEPSTARASERRLVSTTHACPPPAMTAWARSGRGFSSAQRCEQFSQRRRGDVLRVSR